MMRPLQIVGPGPRSWSQALALAAENDEQRRATEFFLGVLGQNWPGWTKNSPLAAHMGVKYQGGVEEWTRIYRLIRDIGDDESIRVTLRKNLGAPSWKIYSAALMQLEVMARMAHSGRSIEFLPDGRRTEGGAPKMPDARVYLADRPIIVEFKGLYESEGATRYDSIIHACNFGLMRRDVDVVTRTLIELRESALNADPELLAEEVADAVKRDSPEPVHLSSGHACVHRVAPWHGGFRLPVPAQKLVGARVFDKLKKYRRQLRASESSVLVIRTRQGDLQRWRAPLFESFLLRGELLRRMEEIAALSAIVLYDESLTDPLATIQRQIPSVLNLAVGGMDGCARIALLLLNPHAANPLTPGEADALVGPDMIW